MSLRKDGRRLTNDGDVVLLSLELPQSNIDGDTTLALGLELVKNPRILEGTLAELSGFLYEWSVYASGSSIVFLCSDWSVNPFGRRQEVAWRRSQKEKQSVEAG